jgi:PIN domain nuclease of toxin-antitoxin system
MKYLLDTHVAVRWVTDDRKLDKEHVRILERAERSGDAVGLSAISLWETAMLIERERIDLAVSVDELFEILERSASLLPIDRRVAIESTRLGARMHGDPADQLIVATARCHGLTLLTSDRRLIACGLVAVA